MNLEIGSTAGDYQVIGILGAGGMGKVYKVRNVISDRVEAMKVLLPDLVNQPELADRFLREIKTQASLEHPNIASLHTALRVENQLVMLMEFVEGVTLEQRLKDGPLPVDAAVDYISQTLSALEYAHRRGVIHRDIKPANMMLTPAGVVKLMDFGIAKATTDQRLTMTGTTMGSLYYMSPEQIQGTGQLDARSDLYAVGVSLYELVTGKRPFDGDSQFAIMSAHLEKAPVPPVEIDPRLPRGLNDAILMSVAKDPAMRFQTAAAFRAALGNAVAMEAPARAEVSAVAQPMLAPPMAAPVPAPVVSPAFQPMVSATSKPKSKRGVWMAVGALAAVLGAIAVVEFAPAKRTKAETPAAQTPPPVASGPAPVSSPVSAPAQASGPSPAPLVTPSATVAPAKTETPSTGKPKGLRAVNTKQGEKISAAPAAGSAAQPVVQSAQPALAAPPVQQSAPPAQPARPPAEVQVQPSPVNRAEVQAARERYVQLDARASGIRQSLQSLQRAQAASGLNLSSRFTGPAALMDSYLKGAGDALHESDSAAANDLMDKAERQVEVLEKLLNR